jgi:hypothetical protein
MIPDSKVDLSVSPNGVIMAVGDGEGDDEWIRFESGEWSYESDRHPDEREVPDEMLSDFD